LGNLIESMPCKLEGPQPIPITTTKLAEQRTLQEARQHDLGDTTIKVVFHIKL